MPWSFVWSERVWSSSTFAVWEAQNPRLWTAWFIPMLLLAPSWTLFSSRYYDSFNHEIGHDRGDTDAIFRMIGFDADKSSFLFYMYMSILSPYHFAPEIVAAMDLPGQGYSSTAAEWAEGLAVAARTIYPMFMFGSLCAHGMKFIFTRVAQEVAGYTEALFQYYILWWILPKWFFKIRFVWCLFGMLILAPLNFIINLSSGRNPAMPNLRRQSSSELFKQAMYEQIYMQNNDIVARAWQRQLRYG